jgi:leucine-rich repeat protein SHOC2
MTQEELAAVIEKAKKDRSTSLDLSKSNLTELPESIGELIELTSLDISNNKLTTLPESLYNLTNLKELNLSETAIESLSERIGNLALLELLDAGGNSISLLPENIGNLLNLKQLDLRMNELTHIPESYANLTALERLELFFNQISILPDFIKNLRNLEIISLDDNLSTDLSILQLLPALEIVDMFEVELPRRYWMKSSDWNPEWLLDEDNAEIRKTLIEQVGYEKICDKLGAIEIDAWREYHLLKINADVDLEPIFLLKMTCPSTQHIHVLRVPPTMTNAEDAIVWVNHGIHPDNFAVQT